MDIHAMTDNLVYLAGPKNAPNSLLAMFLEKETGFKCAPLDRLSDIHNHNSGNGGHPKFVLWDCHGRDMEDFMSELENVGTRALSANLVALFNVTPTLGIEQEALSLGVRGIFYVQDSLDHFAKGISAIMKGEVWAPRKIMGECIKKNVNSEGLTAGNGTRLSNREGEIMNLLVSGLSNEQIAQRFCISSYTVKTHLHNIFKKIKVRGRVQAAMWAAKNL
jgi:LuxR family transcriptional regulator, positive regulator of biofilm formation